MRSNTVIWQDLRNIQWLIIVPGAAIVCLAAYQNNTLAMMAGIAFTVMTIFCELYRTLAKKQNELIKSIMQQWQSTIKFTEEVISHDTEKIKELVARAQKLERSKDTPTQH